MSKSKDYVPVSLRVDLRKVLERNQEIFKLLDWYLAQNIFYKNLIKRLRGKKCLKDKETKLVVIDDTILHVWKEADDLSLVDVNKLIQQIKEVLLQ